MSEQTIIQIGVEAMSTLFYLSGPLLLAALSVGLLVSVFQAVTQINEATLTFIPKMIAVVLTLFVLAPWMLEILKNYTVHVLGHLEEWME